MADMEDVVLERVRAAFPGLDPEDKSTWESISGIAATLSCWKYGHPGQPSRWLSKWQDRPWRCTRCGTWWVTTPHHGYEYSQWAWTMIDTPWKDPS